MCDAFALWEIQIQCFRSFDFYRSLLVCLSQLLLLNGGAILSAVRGNHCTIGIISLLPDV